jgi:hypothetical protein
MTDEAEVIEKPKARKAKASAKSQGKKPHRGSENLKPWKPGESGNPAGPRAGYRQEFSRSFVSGVAKHFAKVGDKAIEKVYRENPLGYLRVCASLVDQEINVKTPFSHLDHLTDDQLRASIAELNERVLHALAAAGGDVSRPPAPGEPEQVGKLPTVLKAT